LLAHILSHHNWGNKIIQLFRDKWMNLFELASRFRKEKQRSAENICGIINVPHVILLISLFLLVFPIKVKSFSHHTSLVSFNHSFQLDGVGDVKPVKINVPYRSVSLDNPAESVSIAQLLSDPSQYHRKIIKVRGTVTQPELHVDESGLFIRFVFVLKEAENTLIVFGHHDRTQGNIQIEMNETVEVVGIFWKERTANDHQFRNNLEAITVTNYPQLHPHAA
jgi:hypothetical protein